MKALIFHPFHTKWGRVGTLFFSLVFLFVLFYNPPLKLCDGLKSYYNKGLKEKKLPYVNPELLKVEHDKAVNEIKMRSEQNDAWFRSKFVLVGGLIAFLIGYLAQSEKTQKEPFEESPGTKKPNSETLGSSEGELGEKAIGKLLNSNATCTVLALACLLAVSIDIHNRISDSTINQLGLWIANYVEPAFLYAQEKNDKKDSPKAESSSTENENEFLPWEQFLRLEKDKCENSNNDSGNETPKGISMHTDKFFSITSLQYGYFLTWLLYLSYLAVLQQVCYQRKKRELTKQQLAIMWGVFLVVHLPMLYFVLTAHIAPSAFEFIILSCQVRGNQLWWRFLIPWFFLLVASLPYLFKPSSDCDRKAQKKVTSLPYLKLSSNADRKAQGQQASNQGPEQRTSDS